MITVPDDAYADLAEADTYHVRRNPAWALLSPDERESRLIRASDYLDSAYRFRYAKTDPAQPRQFPRKGMTDIPREVKQAVMELANNTALVSGSLTAAAVQKRQRVKVDVIEVQYAESADTKKGTQFPLIDGLLRDWIIPDGVSIGGITAGSGASRCGCNGLVP